MNLKKFLSLINFTAYTNNYVKFWRAIMRIASWPIWKRPFELVSFGRERIVYKRGNYVIKVPLNVMGFASNEKEYMTYQSTDHGWLFGIRYARCRLHWSGLLVMEYVEPTTEKYLPSWTDYVDCQQVGYNKKGNLVAYDYGY